MPALHHCLPPTHDSTSALHSARPQLSTRSLSPASLIEASGSHRPSLRHLQCLPSASTQSQGSTGLLLCAAGAPDRPVLRRSTVAYLLNGLLPLCCRASQCSSISTPSPVAAFRYESANYPSISISKSSRTYSALNTGCLCGAHTARTSPPFPFESCLFRWRRILYLSRATTMPRTAPRTALPILSLRLSNLTGRKRHQGTFL
ncbi:hypothetical protein V8E36_004016 [Tilletia maclaganii]